MVKRAAAAAAVLALAGLLPAVRAAGAEPPKRPGSIKGSVKWAGELPALEPFATGRDEAACGKTVPDDSLLVAKTGTLAGVVVFLDGFKETGGPKRTVTMDLKGCRFQPRVVSMSVGDELVLGSSDEVFHNLHALHLGPDGAGPERLLFNLAFPPGSQRVKVKARESGTMLVRGELTHPWMRGVVRVFDHPFHAVSRADGTFDLNNVPPGTYTLRAWHERLGTAETRVEVLPQTNSRPVLEFTVATLKAAAWEPAHVVVMPDAGVPRQAASVVGVEDGGVAPRAVPVRVAVDGGVPAAP